MSKASKIYNYESVFPQRFRTLMDERGITQGVIAEICAVKRQSVSQWLNGETRPDILSLTNIAQYFNVSTDYLLGLTDVKSTDKATKQLCATLGLSEDAIKVLTADNTSFVPDMLRGIFDRSVRANPKFSKEINVDELVSLGLNSFANSAQCVFNRLIDDLRTDQLGGSLLTKIEKFYEAIEIKDAAISTEHGGVDIPINSALKIHAGNFYESFDLNSLIISARLNDITAKLTSMKDKTLSKE